MMRRNDIATIRVHLRDGVRFVRLVNGGAYDAKKGEGAPCGFELFIGNEGEHDAHDRMQQLHRFVAIGKERSGDDQDAEKAQRDFLRDNIRREEPLHRQICLFTLRQGTAHDLIAPPREIERLDDVHAVQLFEYSRNERRLCFLPSRREAAGFFLHSRCNTQISGHAQEEDRADAPIEDEQHWDEDERIQKPGQRTDKHHRSCLLHIP